MKKILLSLITLITVNVLVAQNCTPNPMYTSPGVYPDSATGIAPAYVGVPYSETVTAVTPVDTCIVLIFPPCTVIPIDSVVVDVFSGLPAGFTVKSMNENALNFKFLGGTSSCMIITGTATAGQVGSYPLTVSGLSWATVFGVPTSQPFNVDYYTLVVLPSGVGIDELSSTEFSVKQNSPNPFSSNSIIEYSVPSAGKIAVDVRNVLGELIYSENITAQKGTNRLLLDASKFSNGMYFYQINYNNTTITKRIIVNK